MTFGDNDGVTTGTTTIQIVPPPAGTTGHTERVCRGITVYNPNAGAVTATIAKHYIVGATTRILFVVSIAAGATWTFGDKGQVICLTNTDCEINLKLGAAPTTQCDWTSSFGDQ